jgi:DnaK suppressor protein
MTFTTDVSPVHRELAATLQRRKEELRALLQQSAAIDHDSPPEVLDFKDVAAEETRSVVDEITLAHAAGELDQVVAALRRLREGSYGCCQDCGEDIDGRRLLALPSTPFCTDCQALHERPGMPRASARG